ncbi:MAG: hypothetical protein ACMUHB_03640 [Thermoplasmatota archaeon]
MIREYRTSTTFLRYYLPHLKAYYFVFILIILIMESLLLTPSFISLLQDGFYLWYLEAFLGILGVMFLISLLFLPLQMYWVISKGREVLDAYYVVAGDIGIAIQAMNERTNIIYRLKVNYPHISRIYKMTKEDWKDLRRRNPFHSFLLETPLKERYHFFTVGARWQDLVAIELKELYSEEYLNLIREIRELYEKDRERNPFTYLVHMIKEWIRNLPLIGWARERALKRRAGKKPWENIMILEIGEGRAEDFIRYVRDTMTDEFRISSLMKFSFEIMDMHRANNEKEGGAKER